ncbi:hypothetical protein O6H91_19G071500 [Diphasiastrum complanatum]|nr:hypothetical protein O6H91_19G071500 [Diphasiastrum complanatum]
MPPFLKEVPFCTKIFWVRDCIGKDGDARKPIAPFEPQSPTGQFLVQILRNYPHLFPAAADQQLEQLAADREASTVQEQLKISESYLVLYRRIASLKAEERRKAVEEAMYALLLQKFHKAGIEMVPNVESLFKKQRDGIFSSQEKYFEAVHSPEALEMMREHLKLVLGGREIYLATDTRIFAQISKFHFGQLYAISIMYGYFLRRVDQCFQLEIQMSKNVPASEGIHEAAQLVVFDEEYHEKEKEEYTGDSLAAEAAAAIAALRAGRAKFTQSTFTHQERKLSRLGAYIMTFDHESLGRFATMRAYETVNVIERHAEALFGKPEIHVAPDGSLRLPKDDTMEMTMSGLKELLLEAVTFGSFLWDVESHVDSHYNIIS